MEGTSEVPDAKANIVSALLHEHSERALRRAARYTEFVKEMVKK